MDIEPLAPGGSPATPMIEPTSTAPRAALRHIFRTIASEVAKSGDRRAWLPRVRGLIDAARGELRQRFERDGDADGFMRGWTRVADDVVIGSLHVARFRTDARLHGVVAPLAAVAVGSYGRRELAPASDLDLLFLLPSNDEGYGRGEGMIAFALAALWDLGFEVGHAARTPCACIDLARGDTSVATGLIDARPLWGCFSLYAVMSADLSALLAQEPATRHLRQELEASLRAGARAEEPAEPHVKKGSGALRDIQRLRWLARLQTPGSFAAADAQLDAACRFLTAERCHLHLLTGRAEERLARPLQAQLALRMGLGRAGSTLLAQHHAHTRAVRALVGNLLARRTGTVHGDRYPRVYV